ncbi:MAG: DUF86 domain-containing protein [Candidatus Hydrogenedentota bacterium]
MRDPAERLRDILQAIENIERYVPRGKSALEDDELLQTWMLHNLQTIGEAVRALPDDVRMQEPGVPWAKIIGIRNILVHGYFAIDTEIVWQAAERDIPALRASIQRLLEGLNSE